MTRRAWLKLLNLCIDSKTDSYDAWHACTVNTNWRDNVWLMNPLVTAFCSRYTHTKVPCQNAAHAHSSIQSLRPHICIAVHCSIPCILKCLGIMSQLITGNYVTKLKGIALEFSCQRGVQQFALHWQPKAQVSRGADCLRVCLLSKSKSQIASTLANF